MPTNDLNEVYIKEGKFRTDGPSFFLSLLLLCRDIIGALKSHMTLTPRSHMLIES